MPVAQPILARLTILSHTQSDDNAFKSCEPGMDDLDRSLLRKSTVGASLNKSYIPDIKDGRYG